MAINYTNFVKGYWKPPVVKPEDINILYAANCMAGEAGETSDAVKKYLKGTGSKEDILLEMGDTLYYMEALAQEMGYTLTDVMDANIVKLNKRFAVAGAYGN